MKFTLTWLKRYLDTKASLKKIVDTLIKIGLEVEEVIDRRNELKGLEVVYIKDVINHPVNKLLKICTIKTKNGDITVISRADNVRAGIKTVLAKVGFIIPRHDSIVQEKVLDGIKSFGVLCSEQDLLINNSFDDHNVIELENKSRIGSSFIKSFGLVYPVICINVTPNRSDALGVYGIARDLSAAGIGKLKKLKIKNVINNSYGSFNTKIKNSDICKISTYCEIDGVSNKPSPKWLRGFLTSIGLKSIGAIPDIVKYIIYTFSQSVFVYDASKLVSNHLTIEKIKETLIFKASNGKQYILEEGDIIVKDELQIISIAGIIEGEHVKYHSNSKRIILEVSSFNSLMIRNTSQRLKIETDTKHRLERGVDQNFVAKTLTIAASMIIDVCGGKVAKIITSYKHPKKNMITLSYDLLTSILGFKIEVSKVLSILELLGFNPKKSNEKIKVKIPTWRHDILTKHDIVEEVIRIYGYHKIPSISLPLTKETNFLPSKHFNTEILKKVLAQRGYNEVITWSFMNSDLAKITTLLKDELFLENPIHSQLNYMRPSIIPNLLNIAFKNICRSIKDISIFESGPVFDDINSEKNSIAGIRCGSILPLNCYSERRIVDIFDIKSDLELLLAHFGYSIDECLINNCNLPKYYNTNKSASIYFSSDIIAHFGYIKVEVLKRFNIECEVLAFELNDIISNTLKVQKGAFQPSDFQVVNRDFAFIIPKEQRIGDIISHIKGLDKKLIRSVILFDVFSGGKLKKESKSIAISVTMQSDTFNLDNKDISSLSDLIITSTEQKFKANIRDW